MRMHVGSADVGGLVEVVEFDEPGDLSWTNVTGIDQRGRWRLRERGDGAHEGHAAALATTRPAASSAMISDRMSAPMVARNLERTLEQPASASSKGEDGGEPSEGRA